MFDIAAAKRRKKNKKTCTQRKLSCQRKSAGVGIGGVQPNKTFKRGGTKPSNAADTTIEAVFRTSKRNMVKTWYWGGGENRNYFRCNRVAERFDTAAITWNAQQLAATTFTCTLRYQFTCIHMHVEISTKARRGWEWQSAAKQNFQVRRNQHHSAAKHTLQARWNKTLKFGGKKKQLESRRPILLS